jgi:hypothetical protein
MKKILLISSLLICISGFSQPPNIEQEDSTKHYIYVDIMGISKSLQTTMSAKTTQNVNVFLDFGNGIVYTPEEPLKDDETGKPIIFNSMVDALNYLSEKGWEFETAYAIEQAAGSSFERHITHCLMKRIKK